MRPMTAGEMGWFAVLLFVSGMVIGAIGFDMWRQETACHHENWQVLREYEVIGGFAVDFSPNRTYVFARETPKGYSPLEVVRVRLCEYQGKFFIKEVVRG